MATWISDENGNRCSVEYWLPVIGYRGTYEVSTSGNVRSCDRININRNGVCRLLRGKPLRASIDSEGYQEVGLLLDGKETKARVHRLVASAFVKNPDSKPIVDHKDRARTNNSVRNLRWATYAENRANSKQNPSRFYGPADMALADMKRLAEQE